MDNIITIKDLSFFYDGILIFNNLNYNIKRGSWVTIIGSNGSGKSTLINLLSGLYKYDGEIVIDVNDKEKDLGIVPCNFEFSHDSVLDELRSVVGSDNDSIVDNIIRDFGLKRYVNLNPYNLSDGEKQMVLIARTMVSNPKIIIFDGSLELLDIRERQRIIKILKRYHKRGMTVINITHKVDDALLGDTVTIFDKGSIVLSGSKDDVFSNDKIFKELKLELPFIVDLSIKLKYYGMVQKIYFDMEDLVDEIWK